MINVCNHCIYLQFKVQQHDLNIKCIMIYDTSIYTYISKHRRHRPLVVNYFSDYNFFSNVFLNFIVLKSIEQFTFIYVNQYSIL